MLIKIMLKLSFFRFNKIKKRENGKLKADKVYIDTMFERPILQPIGKKKRVGKNDSNIEKATAIAENNAIKVNF